jgi:L-ascorbate metabolism protein UlaG (beta-lactamase superfamily)
MGLRVPRFVGYLLDREKCDDRDLRVAEGLGWDRSHDTAARLPDGLELQWLGTAGFRLSYAGVHLLIDPYFSRASLRRVISRRPVLPRDELVDRHVTAADAVLVGHTHFDHAVDIPRIAQRTGAKVFGSRSTASLMRLWGLSDCMVEVDPFRVYEVGPFAITFVPSLHSKLVVGLYVPADGDVSCEHFDDLTAGEYRCGQVWGIRIEVAGTTFYHQGSANLIDDAIPTGGVDFFLAGISGRAFTDRYLARILSRLQPRVIVPHHWDDFLRPIDAPMAPSFNVAFARFPDEVAAVSRDFAIRTLAPLQTVRGSTA